MNKKSIVQIAKECGGILSEKKGEKVVVLDLKAVNTYLDYFIICTGISKVHCRALAKEAERFFTERGLHGNGKDISDSDWVVLDYNDIVVHVFTEEMRTHYALEKLWSDAKVLL